MKKTLKSYDEKEEVKETLDDERTRFINERIKRIVRKIKPYLQNINGDENAKSSLIAQFDEETKDPDVKNLAAVLLAKDIAEAAILVINGYADLIDLMEDKFAIYNAEMERRIPKEKFDIISNELTEARQESEVVSIKPMSLGLKAYVDSEINKGETSRAIVNRLNFMRANAITMRRAGLLTDYARDIMISLIEVNIKYVKSKGVGEIKLNQLNQDIKEPNIDDREVTEDDETFEGPELEDDIVMKNPTK